MRAEPRPRLARLGLWLGLAVTAASVGATWLVLQRDEAVQPAGVVPVTAVAAPGPGMRQEADRSADTVQAAAPPDAEGALKHFDALPATARAVDPEEAAGGKLTPPSEPAGLPQGMVAYYPRHSGR